MKIKRFIKFTTVSLLVTLTFFGAQAAPKSDSLQAKKQLTNLLFTQIQEVAQLFMKKYPPTKYHYLGPGRSPHAILAYIEALDLGTVTYIPMSNAKWHFEDTNFKNLRTVEREEEMKKHFAKFLPTDKELGEKKLLVVDFTDNGTGIGFAVYYTIETLFERGSDLLGLKGVGLHLTSGDVKEVWRNNKKKETTTVEIEPFLTWEYGPDGKINRGNSAIYAAMAFGQEEDWLTYHSPVGRYDLQTMIKDENYSEARPQYQELLQWLRATHQMLSSHQCLKSFIKNFEN